LTVIPHPTRRPQWRVFGLPGETPVEREAAARFLREQGFEAVTVAADTPLEHLQPARALGLAVWGCRAAVSVRGRDDDAVPPLLARDAAGAPQRRFGSGCPNQPALRRDHLDTITRLAGGGAFAGFMLDGIRFASPNAGPGFFTCFCEVCSTRAAALGLDVARMRGDVARLAREGLPLAPTPPALVAALTQRPGLADWLRFRAACVTEHVREVRAAVDRSNAAQGGSFRLGAYLFPPWFAPLVGQEYRQLVPLLDVVSPMVYRTLEGDATLTGEWSSLARRRLLPACPAFTVAQTAEAVATARALIPAGGPALVPILQLDDDLVGEATRATVAAGADGADYFSFRAGHEPYLTAARTARAG
jgi:hypothetical protein